MWRLRCVMRCCIRCEKGMKKRKLDSERDWEKQEDSP